MKKLLISLAILALTATMALAATQTGNLIVTVVSEEGQALPGASITISSNVLMGTRTQIAGSNGKATFRNLPPGEYAIAVSMDGFQPYRQTGVDIRLQKTSKADVQMKLGEAKEIIEVVGTGPIVDTSNSTVAAQFDFDNYINHMPTYRHYTSIAGLAGGVINANNPNMAGGGTYSNTYMIDGALSMDSRTHTWGNQFNVDAIADVTVMTGGATAEFGHAMGGIMNIVSKSGSNEVNILGRVELWRKNWNDLSENNPAITTDNNRQGLEGQVWNISGGGPLYPDMVWWYIGYSKYERETGYNRYLNINDLTALTAAIRTYYGHLFNLKGTVQLGEDLKLTAFYREDPIDIYNTESGRADYLGPQCLPEADGIQTQGGDNLLFSGSFIVNENMFVEGTYSKDRGDLDVVAQGDDPSGEGKWTASLTTGPSFNSDDGWWYGAHYQNYYSQRQTDTIRGAFNYLLESESLGSHDVKIGVEWLDNWGNIQQVYYPTNEFIQTGVLTGVGFDAVPYLYRFIYENRLPAQETHGKYWTIYLQDSLQLSDALTLNLGMRTDIGKLTNNQDEEVLSDGIFTALAPRVGFAYDLSGSAIRGSYGRFFDIYNMYMVDSFCYYTNPEHVTKYAPADGVDGRNGWVYLDDWYNGSTEIGDTLDPNLSPSYVEEFTLGFDWMLSDVFAITLTGQYRNFKDQVCWQDPDGDNYGYWTNLETPDYGASVKRYWAGILEVRKRPTEDNLFLNATLTYQSVEGFAASPFTTAYYANPYQTDARIPNFWGDVVGYNWFAKAQATYFFPNNWYIGIQANWTQGLSATSTRTVAVPGYGLVASIPNGRADMERLPGDIFIDFQFGIEQNIELPFDVPMWDDTILLGIYADVFNILGAEQETGIQTNLANTRYGQANAWRQARNYELGFRIEL